MTEDNDSVGNTSKRVDNNSSTGGGNNITSHQQQQDPSLSPSMMVQQPITDSFSAQRVFKKSSPNNKLTLYLCSRDLVVSGGRIDRLQGVLLIDPEYIEDRKVYGQITLTFRYGREDEEVMGLKFCNEAIMCLAQLYPPSVLGPCQEMNTPLQEALIKRLGPNAYPFTMEITPLAPPSVQLVPAKEYRGAPIGTSYDVRAYVAERADEKLQKRSTVRMGLRVLQHAAIPPAPALYNPGTTGNVFYSNTEDKPPSITQQKSKKFLADQKIQSNIDDIENSSSKESTMKRKKSSKKSKSHQASTITLHSCLTDSTPTKNVDNMPTSTNQQLLKESNLNRNTTLTGSTKSDKQQQFRDIQSDIEKLNDSVPKPKGTIVKTFMMSEGQIELEGSLDKSIYSHGESVFVNIQVNNRSHKTVRRIKAFIVQHVDVCMFSNGKFKNVVANIDSKEGCPIQPNTTYTKTYALKPVRSSTKNWIALEDSYSKLGTSLASTVTPTSSDGTPSERNVFAIYVSYYVKIKLIISVVTVTEVSLKLPFTLMHTCTDSIGMEYDVQQTISANMLPSLNFEKENILTEKSADDT